MRPLGDLEAEIMNRLWDWNRPTSVREVLDDINRVRPLAYTTVMTVMDNLHNKGIVSRERAGRAFLYTPTQSRAEFSAELISAAVRNTGDRAGALMHFIGELTPKELAQLRQALDETDRPARKKRRQT